MRGFRHRAARVVHVGARQQQQRTLAPQWPLRGYALKAPPPWPDPPALGNRVNGHETDVVSVAGVARTGIAEPDEEQHGVASVRSCPRKRTVPNTKSMQDVILAERSESRDHEHRTYGAILSL